MDEKCCDAAVDYDCISKSRLVRQILEIDNILISPKAFNEIMVVIQNQVPYDEIDNRGK